MNAFSDSTALKNQIEKLLSEGEAYEDCGNIELAFKSYEKSTLLAKELKSLSDARESRFAYLPWLYYGKLFLDLKNYKSAMKAFENSSAEYSPLKAFSFSFMGQCYRELGEFKKAEEKYKESICENPSSETLMYLYELLMQSGGREEEAEECLKQVLEIDPENEEAYYNLGVFFSMKGDIPSSNEFLEKAIRIDPDYAIAYTELALNTIGSIEVDGSSELRKALKLLEKSVDLDSEHLWSNLYLANVYWRCKQPLKAEKQYLHVLKQHSSESLAFWAYAEFLVYEKEKSFPLAENHFKRALELAGDDFQPFYIYGKALFRWERHAEAKNMLEKAFELGSDEAGDFLKNFSAELIQ